MKKKNRRKFLTQAALGSLLMVGSSKIKGSTHTLTYQQAKFSTDSYSTNDQINIGFIGCGIMGQNNAKTASKINGIKIYAACDLYTGRLSRMKELFGEDVKTYDHYPELLADTSIDVVCISTTDHWHNKIMKAALAAGKAVYCEKPMMHHLEEGLPMVMAEDNAKLPVQIGSQRSSNLAILKARELYRKGEIGDLIMVDMKWDRNTYLGAQNYSIPTDASPDTVSWDHFIGDSPKLPFDAKRFFRWRHYYDYGTGPFGDLAVHLITALHTILSSHGPEKIYASGGLRFWEDGRQVPDLVMAIFDYPENENHPRFNAQCRVNLSDGSGGGSYIQLIGSDGSISANWNSVKVIKKAVNTNPTYGGWDAYNTFSSTERKKYEEWFNLKYGGKPSKMIGPNEVLYETPKGYSDHYHHWENFIMAIRKGSGQLQNTRFGLRAAAPALASNLSVKERKPILWDNKNFKTR